jgi:hypothetical protein
MLQNSVRKTTVNGITYYIPSEKLVNHLKEQLQRLKEIELDKESEDDTKRERRRNNYENLNRMKVYYLDPIFQAMADLKFFFAVIAKYPALERYFGDDIMDLLGVRRKKPSDESKRGPSCGFVFYDLLNDILKVGQFSFQKEKEDEEEKKEREKKEAMTKADFRLILNHLAEQIVTKKVSTSLRSGYVGTNQRWGLANPEDENVREVILSDLTRALAWTGMLASEARKNPDVNEEPDRTFDFDTAELELHGRVCVKLYDKKTRATKSREIKRVHGL